jgi:hypothetical protein
VQDAVSSGVRQKVEEDRKHIIEAAVVRIMKARFQDAYHARKVYRMELLPRSNIALR